MGASAALMAVGGGAQLGTSLLQFQQGRSSAKITEMESETAARQEELGATAREADRKSRLAEALASQNAQAAAGGIAAFEGSPLSILESDIATEKQATERDIFQSRIKAEALRSGGKIRAQQLRAGSALGLLGDLGKLSTQAGMAGRTAPAAK